METRCWNCGTEHDSVTGVEDKDYKPNNGDFSFCFDCGAFAIFDNTFADAVRKPTPQENVELRNNKEIQKLIIAWIIHLREKHDLQNQNNSEGTRT